MDEDQVRERMTAFVVSSGMAQTNYNLINQTGTVSLDTLEKFSKRLRVEPYELLASIRRREIMMIFYYIVVRMPLSYLLSLLGVGLNGIWVAVLISHICAAAASTIVSTLQFKMSK